ncbi:MAG: polyprenyl synthetase family protein [Prevotella sp.]|nr:polyprenyl synthetase family protein [Prevotella sp.]
MDYLSIIRQPIESDFIEFQQRFQDSLTHPDGLLSQALNHIRQRAGKQMRPMLTLLSAKNYGEVSDVTQDAAIALELLHTASLVHDDVVDESSERRGQPSVNASYNNKVAILVGDYILSTCLQHVSFTKNHKILYYLSELGRTLAAGEILQLQNINNQEISEEVYYQVIKQKTAALFETCCGIGALSAGASDEEVEKAKKFGQDLGVIFQIRDDIFDYFDSKEIGKPTGNDMAEGKLTLPVIYALNNTDFEAMQTLAKKVKARTINPDEIAVLVEFTKQHGGIEYAEQRMEEIAREAQEYITQYVKQDLKESYTAYLEYVIQRKL